MLEPAGDERVEAPEDRDAFRGVVAHPRRGPDRQANKPVAEQSAGDQLDRRRVHLGGGDIDDQRAFAAEHQTAAAGHENHRKHDAACEIADPGGAPGRGKIPQAGPPLSQPKVMNIVWPVNRSEPAKMTRVRAMPNEAPMTTGRMLGSTFAPTQKIKMIPSPT